MRTIKIIILLLLSNFCIYSQIINGDFSNVTFLGGDCVANTGPGIIMSASPFVACSSLYGIYGWVASHGSPEIYNLNGNTNNIATMWSGRWYNNFIPTGEGIYTWCYFIKDKVYHVTLKMFCLLDNSSSSGPTIDNFISKVYIKLGNNVPLQTVVDYSSGAPYYSIPVVSSTQTILELTNYNGTPQNIDFYFTPNDDYLDFWIYPVHNNGTYHISVLGVDDISIDNCVPNITYSNTSALPNITLRGDYIRAMNNTQVLNTQNVTFSAGNYITLDPGFVANSGSTFLAYIAGCSQVTCTTPNR